VSKFIVIEGLIGVGKTSLCRLVQQKWEAKLVLEPCEDNPFLAAFYADPKRYAFPAQMFYLASRFAQQLELCQHELFTSLIVADYLFEKDRLFAELTLNEDELGLYDRFANLLRGSLSKPDFVLFLDAPTKAIMQRIKRRSIAAEQVIEASYLNALRSRYYKLWDRWDRCPVYVIDTERINYVDNPDHAAWIIGLIDGWLAQQPVAGAPLPYARPAQQLSLF